MLYLSWWIWIVYVQWCPYFLVAVPMTSPSTLPSGGLHAPSISGALALALHGAKYTTFKFLSEFFPYLGHALVLLIIRTCCGELSSSLMNTMNWKFVEWCVILSSYFLAEWQGGSWNPSSAISLDWEQTTPLSAQAAKRICYLHFSAIIFYWSLLIVKRTRSNKHLFEYWEKIKLLKVHEGNVIAISLLIEILII